MQIYKHITGSESKHLESNNNGRRLIEFAEGQGRKNVYKGTWIAPDGTYTNQIDHIMADVKYSNVINNVKSCIGTDINSDYFFMNIDMQIKKPQ